MKKQLSPADGNDGDSQARHLADSTEHFRRGKRGRAIVELIAISAGQIATANRYDVRLDGMARRAHRFHEHACFAKTPADPQNSSFGCRTQHELSFRRLDELLYATKPQGIPVNPGPGMVIGVDSH